jgi:hypothetical protein
MPRQRLLPHGQFDGFFVLPNEALSTAAKASGIKLNASVKARIFLATMAFVVHGQIEHSASSPAVVRKIKKLLNLTRSLRNDFPNQNRKEWFSDLGKTLRYVLQSEEQLHQVGPAFFLELFSHTLELNQTLLENTLRSLSNSDLKLTKGGSWDLWIVVLTLIFRAAELPTGIRRDELGTSPFVAFVYEIQKHLPDHLKVLYKIRSRDALATAMNRATKGLSFDDVKSADNSLRVFIGAWKPVFDQNGLKFEVEPERDREITNLLERARLIDSRKPFVPGHSAKM